MRGGLVVCLLLAACFTKPPQPTERLDAASESDAACRFSNWDMTPTPIDVAVNAGDAATSPWLSDSRTDLYFTILTGGSSTQPTIVHSTFDGSAWSPPAAVPFFGVQSDNAFLADDGSLWFDNLQATPRHVYEAPAAGNGTFGAVIAHPELSAPDGSSIEASVASDGKTIYFSDAATTGIFVREASGGIVELSQTTGDTIQSPSIAGDGSLFFSKGFGTEVIASSPVVNESLTGVLAVQPFQSTGVFFDPNISRDGKTLVFASNYQGTAHSRLYYVTRSCL